MSFRNRRIEANIMKEILSLNFTMLSSLDNVLNMIRCILQHMRGFYLYRLVLG